MGQEESKPKEKLSGQLERVTFNSPETGFCVLQVKVKGHSELITVVGYNPSIHAGEYIEAEGCWVNDREYGLQFKSDSLKAIVPTTLEGMEKYLGSGLIKGIRGHFAAKLVTAFQEEVFNVIENEPDKLLSIDGIGAGRLQKIKRGWAEQKTVREIMVFLQSHGIGTLRASRIYRTYGEGAIEIVRENPYRLANDIRGIGFKTADQLAMKLGIGSHSPQRAQAGVNYVLLEIAEEGHCAFPRAALIEKAVELLEIPSEIIETALAEEVSAGRLIEDGQDSEPDNLLYLRHLYQAEVQLAVKLRLLQRGEAPLANIDIDKAVQWVEEKAKIQLSDSQKEAIRLAIRSKLLVITGGPGVGKTTLVNSILKILRAKKLKCLLATPTGRAAKRLFETTGLEAKTIHRLLEFDPKEAGFKRNANNPLECDVLVVDETSMVDLLLMNRLLQAVPNNAMVLLVGDVDQLPSVGAGKVLQDIIESEQIPVVKLTEVFRQAAQSQIILNAHRVNSGQMPGSPEMPAGELSDFYFVERNEPEEIYLLLFKLLKERIPERFALDPIEDIQVLSPMNRGGLGTRALNVELQKALNPSSQAISRYGNQYAVGDKVIQTSNNYDKEVFNGDIGVIRKINEEDKELLIAFDGREVEYDFDELDEVDLAYCCSIHKSQGSEYPAIILILHTQHYQMLQKNLVYTGLTRGKRLVIILGSKKAMWIALKRGSGQGGIQRYSRLRERIQGEFAE